MRFLLDNDVDIAVGRVIRAAGHYCEAAHELGLTEIPDDLISVIAQSRKAVVVTADREFTQRRMRNSYGWHLWLRCRDVDAVDVMERWLAISVSQVRVYPSTWE